MIFRKPYAFLIKNFRKIHIVLFLLCAFIMYKTMQLGSFVKDFIKFVSYDAFLEPITKYTSILFYLSTILVIVISAILLLLLRKKQKPWKLYIIPVLTYVFVIFVFLAVQNYFAGYDGETSTATARAFRDFLNIATLPQYATFLILLMRIIGVDLNRFSFGNDEEFLQLEQDDREEVEVSISFDKHIFKRLYRKVIRVVGYFYEEHRFFMNIAIGVLAVILLGSGVSYYFSHKTVKEDQVLNANGYSIQVNESYYTDKDKVGNIIEENSSFVILNLTIKNNSSQREMNMNNFHLVNGSSDVTFSGNTYSDYFSDIGSEYNLGEFRTGEQRTFALIFKVNKKLKKNHFVLYYQQYQSARNVYLRKMKLNLKDVSKIVKNQTKNIGEKLTLTYPDGKQEALTVESAEFVNKTPYNREVCDEDGDCRISADTLVSSPNNKILKMKFTSSSLEGEEFIDFSTDYGKIKYIDSENIAREIEIEDQTENQSYLGKYIYIKVPSSVETSKNIELIYTLRNEQYSYKIR